jgi:predicted HTH transcriptional regulator
MFAFPDVRSATHFPMPEGTHLEFKEGFATPMEKIFATMCGILNAGGGYLVFGVRDSDYAITGIRPKGKEYDQLLLKIDNVYHGQAIRTTDEPSNSVAMGTVTTSLVPAATDKFLLVLTMRPVPGKLYETSEGVRWHRLSASNYRERMPVGVYTKKDLDAAVRSERQKADAKLVKYIQDYSAVLGAAKQHLDKCNSLQKELAEAHELLYKQILDRKRAVEQELAGGSRSRWCLFC